jgi:hypothetical protein
VIRVNSTDTVLPNSQATEDIWRNLAQLAPQVIRVKESRYSAAGTARLKRILGEIWLN